ncbi:ATP-binding protein [Brevundimonas sp.]
MTTTAYAKVAQVRYRELKTRIALAAFIGVTAWLVTRTVWPGVWFMAMLATQALDWLVFSRFRRNPEWMPSRGYLALSCLTTVIGVTVYAGMTGYLWFYGGETGRIFAMIQGAGGLLHVSLHMHHARPILISAVVPHSLYFLGLPVTQAALTSQWHELLVPIGGILYMSHLLVAVRQSSSTTREMQEARDAALDARGKAEVANAAKSDFLAVVSHEIRTPMNAVISAANLLKGTRLDTRQTEHVDMLIDAGDVLMGLLNDVLDVSKIEAGKMELETADMVVRDRLTALGRLWGPRAEANNIHLAWQIAPEVPHCVRTDPLRFQQILFNLMSNAVKFTRDGDILVKLDWADGVLAVAVTDSGCGIPADRLDHVFNSFEQADAGTTRRYGGTGLGLSISRKLAEVMGGSLTVASVEGKGSTFTLHLPLTVVSTQQADAVQATIDVSVLANRSILAADDHPVNRRILALLLEPYGCRLTLVEDGAEAVERASHEPFDVILMDMQMPVMDGLEASRRIRLGGPNRDTPVIALTANAMDTHRAAWDGIGVHAFLTKPINPMLLAVTLAEACGQARVDRVVEAA